MSILYHDIGLLQQRKGHAEISKALLEGDTNDAYIINAIDKEIIAVAVVSHSSSKDIARECARFSPEELIGKHRARPTVVAALVRLSDELDEDHRRADPILKQRLNLPAESSFFWLFCQRVRGIRPNLTSKRIDFNLALEVQDTTNYGPVPGGKTRHFVAFVAEKLAKINHERVTVNRFLPPELQYAGLHVDVKPLRNHPKWMSPRTFVFNDHTTHHMFLQSYPELLDEPAKEVMAGILSLMKQGNLDKADEELNGLASVLTDLPIELQLQIFYEKACVYSMRAETFSGNPERRKHELDKARECLVEWFKLGETGAFKAIGRTADAEVHRMARDPDLKLVLSRRSVKLRREIQDWHWPTSSSGGGCVPLGSLIDMPDSKCPVELVRAGDYVISMKFGSANERVRAKVAAVVTTRSTHCIQLNRSWLVTPRQPVLTSTEWVEAVTIKKGDSVMNGHGNLVLVSELKVIEGYFEVFDLMIDDPYHNYVANGLLCHNKMRGD